MYTSSVMLQSSVFVFDNIECNNHDLLYTFFCTQIYAISMVFACYKYLKERMRLSQLGRCYTDNNGDAEVTFSYCAELLNGHLLHAFGNLVIF